MAQIPVNIPDAHVTRVQNAFAIVFNYNPVTDGTKGQFFKAQLAVFIKNIVKTAENQVAVATARNNVETSVDTDIQIT